MKFNNSILDKKLDKTKRLGLLISNSKRVMTSPTAHKPREEDANKEDKMHSGLTIWTKSLMTTFARPARRITALEAEERKS